VTLSLDDFAQQMFVARQDNVHKPLLSEALPDANEAVAYEIQKAFVSLIQEVDQVSGFKAALSNPVAQQMFNAAGPASGVLFASGACSSGDTLDMGRFVTPVLETEIGFRVGQTIENANGPVTRQKLLDSIDATLPMIEVADVGFTERLSSATDLIAGNSGSASYITGAAASNANIDDVKVTFLRDGEELGTGKGGDAMGSQIDSLLWLVNRILSQGYDINSGAYLMTGSLGRIYPAQVGEFVADYGEFGSIAFCFE